VISYKKSSGGPHVEYDALVEEALCFGWIDSKTGALDEARAMGWFAPRKAKTGWSRVNKQRVARLIAAGQMAPADLTKIEAAKKDGSWTALDAVEALIIPPDLRKALASLPAAGANFAAFPRSIKRGILEWKRNAKRPQTRARRVDETARLASQNVRAHQWTKK